MPPKMNDDPTKTAHDLALTGREITHVLRAIAVAIAADDPAGALQAAALLHIRAAFPNLDANEHKRIMRLVGWAMRTQHAATAVELERRRRLAGFFMQPTTETADAAASTGAAAESTTEAANSAGSTWGDQR